MIITISKWSYFKMLKKTLIASAIAAVSFGSMAAAPSGSVNGNPVNFASELFGTDAAKVELKSTSVGFAVSGDSITKDKRADMTVTLKNGTFASDVRPADLVGGEFSVNSIVSGGKAGDNSIVLEITNVNDITSGEVTGALNIIALSAPSLADTATGARVTATLTMKAIDGSGDNTLPEISTNNTVEVAKSSNASAFSITAATVNGEGLIDKEDNSKFSSTDGDWNASQVAFSVTNSGDTIKGANGEPLVVADLFSGADVKFSGPLNDGDIVKFADEAMTVAGSEATTELSNTNTLNGGVVNYAPKGDENLAPSSYTTDIVVSGAAKTTSDLTAQYVASTSYDGQNEFATINAVPSAAAADIMNIRLTNKSSKDSQVFFRVKNLDGTSSGTFQLLVLGGNETTVVTPAMLEEIAGTFTGRPNIEFSSAEEFQALAVMRSNGTLTSFDSDQ
jgi:hypothetical protein